MEQLFYDIEKEHETVVEKMNDLKQLLNNQQFREISETNQRHFITMLIKNYDLQLLIINSLLCTFKELD